MNLWDVLASAAGVLLDPLVLALAALAAMAGDWRVSALAGGAIAWASVAMDVAPAVPSVLGSEVAAFALYGLLRWRRARKAASRPRT